ncbi:hypothetical protein GUA87_17590 [Sneathiella sp. P13V-1]|uniref:hypothetical protein n=1 Tax=Sneathiella sp. P13V-1 TaxID=2697366 RepID=UPI00187B8DDF|nr:hypothetical protein [Sneathiella sp. P13V-1]MBE7638673.1 hypothetical protein [Sneathiella sp. P13V-1]
MDRALFDALNRYDDCMTEDAQSGGGQSASGGGAGSGTSDGGSGSASSTASSDLQGTETPKVAVAPAEAAEEEAEEGQVPQVMPRVLPNGKIPDDIPPANNDDILQKKVREAAMNEPDPEKRERLWEEYRKLKGIPNS